MIVRPLCGVVVPSGGRGGPRRVTAFFVGVIMRGEENVTYGRLLESVHVSGYTAERAVSGLKWLLEGDRWKTVGDGFDDIDDFLNSVNVSQFKIAVEDRKDLVKILDDLRASKRATARAMGVSDTTVHRDLGKSDRGATHVAAEDEKKYGGEQVVVSKQFSEQQEPEYDDNATYVAPRPNPLDTSGDDVHRIAEKQATKAWDKAQLYGHDQGDEWYTPRWLFDALGLQFSIDVCAPPDLTYVTTPADCYYNEQDDGLSQTWHGTVWCNPPYSAPEAWADKCIDHGDGLLLTHIPMNAAWAQRVWTQCDGIRLFQAIEFTRPSGETQRPGSWLMLAAFGNKAKEALRQLTVPGDVAQNPRRVPSPMWVRA